MYTLSWLEPAARSLSCKLCMTHREGEFVAVVSGARPERIEVVRCDVCGSLDLLEDPYDYENYDYEIDDYIEVVAVLGAIADHVAMSGVDGVSRFLDVGSYYGFAMDSASYLYGWNTVGVEPGPAGARGARELGLDIRSSYLEPDSELGGPFDLVLASEVLEHVPDPCSFLISLRAQLAPGGRLLLTTPAAERIVPDVSDTEVLALLSPGLHLFVASEQGLRAVLAAAGFASVVVARRDGSLRAVAAAEPGQQLELGFDEVDRVRLEGYYAERLATADPGSALALGMAARLIRSRVGRGDFDGIEPQRLALIEQLRLRHGLDLDDPSAAHAQIEEAGTAPRVLVGAAHALGMHALLEMRDTLLARELFILAHTAARLWTGVPDVDVEDLRQQTAKLIEHASAQLVEEEALRARILLAEKVTRVRTLVETDQLGAIELALALLADASDADRPVLAELAARAFVDGVVGHGVAVPGEMYEAVAAEAPGLAADAEPDRASTGLDALYALGVAAELRGDHAEAREWYGRCLAACAAAPSAPSAAGLLGLATAALARLP